MSSMTGRAIFNDDSGRRARVFQWGGRGFVVLALSLLTAVVLTLGTQVSLPGLDHLRALDLIHRVTGSERVGSALRPAGRLAPAITAGEAVSPVTTEASVAPPRPEPSASATKADRRAATGQPAELVPRPATTAPPADTTGDSGSTTGARPAVRGADRAAKARGVAKPRNPRAAVPGSSNAQGKSMASNGRGKPATSRGKGKPASRPNSPGGR